MLGLSSPSSSACWLSRFLNSSVFSVAERTASQAVGCGSPSPGRPASRRAVVRCPTGFRTA